MARLFLIDGSNQMYRAYHAIRGLTGPDGRSTNAVYGFVTMLRKLIADHQPEYVAVAFDLAGPTFRSDLAADYKANRRPMPPDLVEQITWIHEACAALGVPVLGHNRYEADDVLGTLAHRAAAQGFEVALVTGDKDFFQLVGGAIKVYNPRDDGAWYDEEGVRTRFGVRPDQVVDVLAIMGDTIDNIKGVPGIGEKGARDLIAAHGTLEALLEQAPSLPNKRHREGLLTYGDQARQSRELVRIHTDVPVELDLGCCRYQGPDRARAFELFSRLGFRTLVTEFAPTAETIDNDYRALTSDEAIAAFVAECETAGHVALHLVTDEPLAMRARLLGLALAHTPRQTRYIPLAAPATERTQRIDRRSANGDLFRSDDSTDAPGAPAALNLLRPLLEDGSIRKIGHDLKSATIVLRRHGIELAGIDTDVELVSYVIDATRSSHRLEDVALEELSYRATSEEDLRGRGIKALPMDRVPEDKLLVWAGERPDLALQLAAPLRRTLRDTSLEPVYASLELPLIPVLIEIEMAGVRVDAAALRGQAATVEADLHERAARIYVMAGESFNINSPKQLADVLFTKLQLPALKRTGKTRTASTAQEVLEELALVHELPREILEWRALQKLKGTYIDALPQLIHPETGRVHTSFSQVTAATGRLSSRDPNLQNVPIRTEVGREIRRAFVAEPGWVLVSADYSQIELRVLAHMSGDESLIDAFRRREDIHDRTALKVFGTSSGLSRHELRRRAKIVNYALLYGKTAFTLARDIGVTREAAEEFIEAYFAGFPAVRRFLDGIIAEARQTSMVKTLFGRRRLVPDVNNRNGQIRAAAERVAVNMPIQGTAADILKRAMIELHGALQAHGGRDRARMILTVHDELLLEVRQEAVDEIAALVRDRMEHAASLAVPLTVEVGMGQNWKEAKG
jgi:DNA polymerase I